MSVENYKMIERAKQPYVAKTMLFFKNLNAEHITGNTVLVGKNYRFHEHKVQNCFS
jgi:hypothetical protein